MIVFKPQVETVIGILEERGGMGVKDEWKDLYISVRRMDNEFISVPASLWIESGLISHARKSSTQFRTPWDKLKCPD